MTRFCVQATWDDVPHLNADQKKKLWDSYPPHEREARAKGIPMLGAGRIYPVAESLITCDPFEIPDYWPRAYGLDIGWNRTAAIWGAWDRSSDCVYMYSEHYQGQQPPAVHASAIMARGDWIPGAMDPAGKGSSQIDGRKLLDEYNAFGLTIVPADNAVEAGIHAVYQRMSRGGLKVFSTLRNWMTEFRIYRRDERGKVVKENDHLMDATRYLIMTGMKWARVEPVAVDNMNEELMMSSGGGRSRVTGY